MNSAQAFMAFQIFSSLLGTVGFGFAGRYWEAGVWLFYAGANFCWFMFSRNS